MREVLVAAVIGVVVLVAAVLADVRRDVGPSVRVSSEVEVCLEDMPCWNCRTMGNRVCGSGATLPD